MFTGTGHHQGWVHVHPQIGSHNLHLPKDGTVLLFLANQAHPACPNLHSLYFLYKANDLPLPLNLPPNLFFLFGPLSLRVRLSLLLDPCSLLRSRQMDPLLHHHLQLHHSVLLVLS